MAKTTIEHVDTLRALAEAYREYGGEQNLEAAEYAEAAADHIEDLDNERDELARRLANAHARLQALEKPLEAIQAAAKYLGFALDLTEPVPVLEVTRGQ